MQTYAHISIDVGESEWQEPASRSYTVALTVRIAHAAIVAFSIALVWCVIAAARPPRGQLLKYECVLLDRGYNQAPVPRASAPETFCRQPGGALK